MTRDELELMWQLKRVCNEVPEFVLEFMSGDLSAEAERAFAYQLKDLAEQLVLHANARRGMTVDGQPTPLIIDADFVRVQSELPELLPGRTPGTSWL